MKKEPKKKIVSLIKILEKKQTHLRSLIQTDKRVLVYLSPNHRILEFNLEAERVYGRKREDVLGKNYFELFLPKSEWKKVDADIKQVLEGKPTIGFESRVLSSDGRESIMSWDVIRIEGKGGMPIGLIASGRDITAIKQIRALLKEFVEKRTSYVNTLIKFMKSKTLELKYAKEVLRQTELPKTSALKPTKLPLIQLNKSGEIISWEHQAEIIFGWSEQEMLGRSLNETIIPLKFRGKHKNGPQRFLNQDEDTLFKRMIFPVLHRNGHQFPAEMIIYPTEMGRSAIVNILVRVITTHENTDGRDDLVATAINAANEAVFITDFDGNTCSVNPAFSRITGYSSKEMIGKNPRILQSGRHDKTFYRTMWDKITTNGHWAGEIWNRRKNGVIYLEWLSITAVKNEQGKITQHIGFFFDITQRKEVEEELYRRANYDNLTGLPNRALFKERLQQVIRLTKRNQKKAALLFVDLDKFKEINDTHGHISGDHILTEVGKRMMTCVREADTIARYSGDEFLVLLSDIPDRKNSLIVANKIIKTLSIPFQLNNLDIYLGASIGITLIPNDGEEMTSLLKNADEAMYKAKARGRNRYYVFNQKTGTHKHEFMESEIRKGIENQEFVIYYQPIVDFFSLKTIALEALIRWNHPERGFILPDQFIPIAEKSGLVCELGEWVLNKACKQTKSWQDKHRYRGAISVNLSSHQIKDVDFDKVLKHVLEDSGLPSQSLTLEIEGDLLLEKESRAFARLERIEKLGVNISIDDFGRGYTSLSDLSRYPVDHLKIDKPFIENVSSDPKKISLVKAIVSMGHHFNMKVLAKGIETDRDLSSLKGLGCDGGQGYFLTRPLSAKNCEAALKSTTINESLH